MPGRKPKPYELRIAEGNTEHRTIPEDRVKTPDSLPVQPKWLDKYGKDEWNRLVGDMVSIGIISRLDSSTLAAYCQAWSRWRHLERKVKKEGYTLLNDKGESRLNPACAEATRLLSLVKGYQSELGLSASARTRLRTNTPPAKRKQGDLLAGPKAGKKD